MSFALRSHPHLYEVNARLWLRRLSRREGRPVRLLDIPDSDLEALARRFDLLWLMGAWRRSAAGRACALETAGLRAAYDRALPGWTEEDVEASPYAVPGYDLNPALGEAGDLGAFRERLHRLGAGLVVDYVPNHVARDHPWTAEHPDWFIQGGEEDLRARPDHFYRAAGGAVLALGKDPNFPPWTDVAQVNYDAQGYRDAAVGLLRSLARSADGVRCDMAMLGLGDVFHGIWGERAGGPTPPGGGEFWSEVIGRVKEESSSFLFIAEAYWGMERRLLDLGFDFAYDKDLYDLLLRFDASAIRGHLASAGPMLERGLRFLENHDERRAAEAFGPGASPAAALAAMTLPGARLVHDGQRDGRTVRLPVQLVREPDEPPNEEMVRFYDRLLEICDTRAFHEGRWDLLDVEPPDGGGSPAGLLAWSWIHDGKPRLVVVNLSGAPAAGRIRAPEGGGWSSAPGTLLRLSGAGDPPGASERGLRVNLAPWDGAIFVLE